MANLFVCDTCLHTVKRKYQIELFDKTECCVCGRHRLGKRITIFSKKNVDSLEKHYV